MNDVFLSWDELLAIYKKNKNGTTTEIEKQDFEMCLATSCWETKSIIDKLEAELAKEL